MPKVQGQLDPCSGFQAGQDYYRDPVLKYQINKQKKERHSQTNKRKTPKEDKIKFNEIMKFTYSLVEIKT